MAYTFVTGIFPGGTEKISCAPYRGGVLQKKFSLILQFTPTTQQRELKSRHPFYVPAVLELLKDLDKSNTVPLQLSG